MSACVCVCACVPQWPPVVIIGDKIESIVFCVVIVIFYLDPMHSGGLKTSTYYCSLHSPVTSGQCSV